LSVASLGTAFYSTEIEPETVQVERVTVGIRHLPPAFEGTTVVQISDLHLGAWMNRERLEDVVRRVNALAPDLIAITGDFVSEVLSHTLDDIRGALRGLRAAEGIYGVLGNHDHWTQPRNITQAAHDAGINMLFNQHAVIRRQGQYLFVAGVDDIWEHLHDLDAALRGVPKDGCVLLLAHEPDFADTVAADDRVALQLSGHSHGGQVRLPLVGAPVLPRLGQKYDAGLYTIDALKLYVNRGVGMIYPAVRLNCPPEITHLTLTRA
jgi:hypothetical protein